LPGPFLKGGRASAGAAALRNRLSVLRKEGAELEARAVSQSKTPVDQLERQAGAALQRSYSVSAGEAGEAWEVDEASLDYRAYDRARFSCVACSGHEQKEQALLGCWPLSPSFGPDEMRFRCSRQRTSAVTAASFNPTTAPQP